jgi:ketosteroid isomerase-like protein
MVVGSDENTVIARLSDQFAEHLNRRDHATAAAMCADDSVLLPPGPRTITGRTEVQSYWAQAEQIRQLRFETRDVRSLGDGAALEIGNLHLTVGPQPREIAAKYVLVWRKPAGQWKIETMIWNAAGGQGRGMGPRAGEGRGGMRGRGGRGRQAAFVPRVE